VVLIIIAVFDPSRFCMYSERILPVHLTCLPSISRPMRRVFFPVLRDYLEFSDDVMPVCIGFASLIGFPQRISFKRDRFLSLEAL